MSEDINPCPVCYSLQEPHGYVLFKHANGFSIT